MTDHIVILCTCGSEQEAAKLARLLVEKSLAACVNIVPGIQSVYRWMGRVESAGEWLLLIKSSRELFGEIARAIQDAHSYDVPEVVALSILEGSADYLNWLRSNIGPPTGSAA